MNTIAVAPKSRLLNWLEGVTLTALLQGFPMFTNAALVMRLSEQGMGSPHNVIVFVMLAALVHGLLVPLLSGPWARKFIKDGYQPVFFDPTLAFADKVAQWRMQPRVSLQLMASVLLLSLLSVAVLSAA